MSGLEVVGLVAGIVSAFSAAGSLYRDWRKQKREREKQSANERLDQLVKTSGPRVQEEYDSDFRRLGQAFAKGDGVGRTALLEQLVTLQQTVITLLSDRQASDILGAAVHPNHETIYNTSFSVKEQSLSALGQMYQRLSSAAPIRNFSSNISVVGNDVGNCRGKIRAYWSANPLPGLNEWVIICQSCQWTGFRLTEWGTMTRNPICTDGKSVCAYCFVRIFHREWYGVYQWRCSICRDQTYFESSGMAVHLRNTHSYSEILPNGCELGNPFFGGTQLDSRSPYKQLVAVFDRGEDTRRGRWYNPRHWEKRSDTKIPTA